MLAGVLSLTLSGLGYIAMYEYVGGYSSVYGIILLVSIAMFMISGTAHHVFCGVVEWFYIKMDRTEKARQTILEFFKKRLLHRRAYLFRNVVHSDRYRNDGFAEMGLRVQRDRLFYSHFALPHSRFVQHSGRGFVFRLIHNAVRGSLKRSETT